MELTNQIHFREATIEDLDRIEEIEKDSFTDNWRFDAFNSCLIGPFYDMNVATIDDRIIGYSIMKCIYEDGELIRIAVDKSMRGKGIGGEILELQLDRARHLGVEKVFLDVRKSNEAAISMYEKLGFARYEITRDFYRAPTEDSIKFRKDIVC